MNHVFGDESMIVLSWVIVNDSCIWSTSTDCFETGSFVVFLLTSEFVHVLSCLIIIDLDEFGSPGPELGHGDSIDKMASSESVDLFLRSNSSVNIDAIPLDGLFVDD